MKRKFKWWLGITITGFIIFYLMFTYLGSHGLPTPFRYYAIAFFTIWVSVRAALREPPTMNGVHK